MTVWMVFHRPFVKPDPMMPHSPPARAPQAGHDHQDCVRAALQAAERRCAQSGARLTLVRKRVLELVWDSHAPVGAYALLDALKAEGQNAAPPTVYRALDFLLEQGLVHRLERLNAYVGCPHPMGPHSAQFLICQTCGQVQELEDPAIGAAIRAGAERLGFLATRQTIEVEGLCQACRTA
ncbi:zinc uptake regulation protein [mine drainage metagenome]|uniref:Zinc uptake regulation protein n=1 Tax=mine drainage metagenome TaxID=410659 RepID=A0A1J5RGG6_9ZZZZ